MADKGDKGIGKQSLNSNPIFTPTSPATSESLRDLHSSYTPDPFYGMSSTCFTPSRNNFSGYSPNLSSTNSRKFCITSIASNSFSSSVLNSESSISSSTGTTLSTCVSTKSSVISFESDNTVTKSTAHSSSGNADVCASASDTSVPVTKASTKIGYDTASGYGGNFEKTAGVITMSSASRTFGGLTKSSSSGFGSESSPGPRLFSGIPSSSLVRGSTESTTEEANPKVTSDSVSAESGNVSSHSSITATLSGDSLEKGQVSGSSGVNPLELREEQESHTEVSGKSDSNATEPTTKESEGTVSFATHAKRKSEDDTNDVMESKRKVTKNLQ